MRGAWRARRALAQSCLAVLAGPARPHHVVSGRGQRTGSTRRESKRGEGKHPAGGGFASGYGRAVALRQSPRWKAEQEKAEERALPLCHKHSRSEDVISMVFLPPLS